MRINLEFNDKSAQVYMKAYERKTDPEFVAATNLVGLVNPDPYYLRRGIKMKIIYWIIGKPYRFLTFLFIIMAIKTILDIKLVIPYVPILK